MEDYEHLLESLAFIRLADVHELLVDLLDGILGDDLRREEGILHAAFVVVFGDVAFGGNELQDEIQVLFPAQTGNPQRTSSPATRWPCSCCPQTPRLRRPAPAWSPGSAGASRTRSC